MEQYKFIAGRQSDHGAQCLEHAKRLITSSNLILPAMSVGDNSVSFANGDEEQRQQQLSFCLGVPLLKTTSRIAPRPSLFDSI